MLYGLYVSAAGMAAQETRQSVLSNNLANAQTTGFKRDLAVMQARNNAAHEDFRMMKYAIPVLKNQGGGVDLANGGIDLQQGTLTGTTNATDVALDGKGFFTVQGEKPGDKLLTRNGQFLINNDGLLVTSDGHKVLSDAGQPIPLNRDLSLTITSSGQVTQGDGTSVQLGLTNVADSRNLIKLGNNLLTVDKPESLTQVPPETKVHQNALESSGVDPIVEMVNMMEGQRAFEANAKMISYQDTTLSELNTIGKVA
jgi:flagellar basal-body rod protein FlgF